MFFIDDFIYDKTIFKKERQSNSMPDEPESDNEFVQNLKNVGKHLKKTVAIKEKAEAVKDSLTEGFDDIKELSQEQLDKVKELTGVNLNIKSEAQFIKKIFQHKDLVFLKTDAIALVLRKLGGNEEFFETVDRLTKEGYRMVHHEAVRNIPIPGGFSYSIGSIYYFQHVKYITSIYHQESNSV